MKRLFLILLLISSYSFAQTYETDFSGYFGTTVTNFPPDPGSYFGKNYHTSILTDFSKSITADSADYKGDVFLYLATQNTWRGNVRWFKDFTSGDTINTSLTPQIYTEFGFLRSSVMNTTFGYFLKNNIIKDSIKGYAIELVNRTTGTDSIRVIRYTNSVGTVMSESPLSFTFQDIWHSGGATIDFTDAAYCLRAQMISDTLKARVWKRTGVEPSGWNITYYDSTFHSLSSYVGELTNIGWQVNIDSMNVVTTAPPSPEAPDTLQFHLPTDNSVYNALDTIHVSWYASKDSVKLVILGNTIYVYNDTTYNYVLPDSTINNFIIYGEVLNHSTTGTTYKDMIYGLSCYKSKYLVIDTVYKSGKNIVVITSSLLVDSVKYYTRPDSSLNWDYIGKAAINKSASPNVTTYSFLPDFFLNVIKVEELRDTTVNSRTVDYTLIGAALPNMSCFYQSIDITRTTIEGRTVTTINTPSPVPNPFDYNFLLDASCLWNASYIGYTGYSTLSYHAIDSSYYYIYNASSASVPFTTCERISPNSIYAEPIYLIDFSSAIYKGNRSAFTYIESNTESRYVNPYGTDRVYYKGYSYYYVNSDHKIYIDDLTTGIDSIEYCDLSNLYAISSIYNVPLFNNDHVSIGVYNIPYELLIAKADSLHLDYASIYKFDCATGSYLYSISGITNSEIDSIPLPTGFIPKLVITDKSWNYNTITLPLLQTHIDTSSVLYDTWQIGFNPDITRTYFRGIHPKIWKWGNIDGIKRD